MQIKNLTLMRFYLLSGALEGVLALVILIMIPVDSKNQWFLGFSKLRLAMAGIILLTAIGFGWASLIIGKKQWHLQLIDRLIAITGTHPMLGPATLFLYGFVIFVPYFIVTYPLLSTLQGVQIRILPVVAYVFTRLLFTIILWVVFSKRALQEIKVGSSKQVQIAFDPWKITVVLAGIAGLLILASMILDIIDTYVGPQQFWGFRMKFDLDQEANVPTYFSSLILLVSASLFGVIGTLKSVSKTAFANHWKGLAFIFFFMSVDETAALHEKLINIVRNWIHPQGIFYYGWVVAAIPLVVIGVVVYLQFFFHLPNKTKRGISLAGFFYLSGAMGLEMVGAGFARTFGENNSSDNLLITIEEALEIFGIILLIHTLLTYLVENFGEVRFKGLSSKNIPVGEN